MPTSEGLALATTYGGRDPSLLEEILPFVDAIEITPDTLAHWTNNKPTLPPSVLEDLCGISERVTILIHGVGLSIGSYEGWFQPYLDMLDTLFSRVPVRWHSEHLGYTRVDGEFLGTMLPLPRTDESLDMLSERITKIQRQFGVPFLVEHVVSILPEPDAEYSPAEFLNSITTATGCGLIIDVYNLECDARNNRWDLAAFLVELDYEPVKEIHVANGVELDGVMLDVHSRFPSESTLALAREVLRRARPHVEVVTFEYLEEAVPSLTRRGIADQLRSLPARLRTNP